MFYVILASFGLLASAPLLLRFLLTCCCIHVRVTDARQTRTIDRKLLCEGVRSVHVSGHRETPDDGFHYHRSGGGGGSSKSLLLLLLLRSTVERAQEIPQIVYDVWSWRHATHKHLLSALDCKPQSGVRCLHYQRLFPYSYVTDVTYCDIAARRDMWHKELVHSILRYYDDRKVAVVLVRGNSGTGKTSLGLSVANTLLLERKERPTLVSGFSYSTPGASLMDVLGTEDEGYPYIIMLNEFERCALPEGKVTAGENRVGGRV